MGQLVAVSSGSVQLRKGLVANVRAKSTLDILKKRKHREETSKLNHGLMLVGQPGSGKTMTLHKWLRSLPNTQVVCRNFFSVSTPELLPTTLGQYCTYGRNSNSAVLKPNNNGRLVLFFD